ncbi:hypothetical protein J3F83DRAFT_738368 [Trichoderma novae-zelandiae]
MSHKQLSAPESYGTSSGACFLEKRPQTNPFSLLATTNQSFPYRQTNPRQSSSELSSYKAPFLRAMATLGGYLNKTVLIVTADSRILVGELAACDQSTNLVLKGAVERIIRTPDDPEPSAEVPLGLYLVRGDNVCSVGLVDPALDKSIDWTLVKGTVIGGIKHI